jgi:NHLM bacteriocin system ABC transporter ATP-binding protein
VVNSRTGLRWFLADDPVLQLGGTAVPAGMPVPLGPRSAVAVTADTVARFATTEQVAAPDRRRALIWVQATILARLITLAQESQTRAAARYADRAAADMGARQVALGDLATIEARETWRPSPGADQILAACQLIGEISGMTVVAPPQWSAGQATDPVRSIARSSNLRVRAVTLTGSWWQGAIDTVLAFRADTGAAVVVVPRGGRGCTLIDPVTGAQTPLPRRGLAAPGPHALRPTGYILAPPLPAGSIGVGRLLRYALAGARADVVRMLLFSLVTAGLSLVIPVATGVILGNLVPEGSTKLVLAAGACLFAVVFASTGIMLGRAARLLRLQGRMLSRMQAGLWDRLLSLPAAFFTRYSVADLTQRVTGVEAIQQIVASVGSQTLLSLVMLLSSAALLFAYDVGLATLVLAVTAGAITLSATVTWRQIRALRMMYDAKGEASGVLLQLVLGMDKVRAAAAENRALAAWAGRFAPQARSLLRSESLSAIRTALYAALPEVLTLLVFAVVGGNPKMMTTTAFLAFITALSQITAATTQLDLSLGYALNILPLFDRMRPILAEPLEVQVGATDPGQLTGRVSLNHVSYAYPGMTEPVLHDLDLEVMPREFVAIVGPSGSGKSTIVRLLLGFDRPQAGTVTFDSKDLATLDARAVRSQIGVAMQNSAVTGGDILSAIIGDWPLTEADAWAAAEQVGLADDIRALPMGMRTMLGENAATFSGGQRQRLVLASAIARNPRLVILDEATSALDSVSQAHVAESFEKLQVTRIVVAHRLSTIRNADRIIVLDGGRIVQEGKFADLVATPGVFQTMVGRQLA